MLSESEFGALAEAVQMAVYQELEAAWTKHCLEEYLRKIGMERFAPQQISHEWDDSLPNGKIIVLGESSIKEREIIASITNQGISKDRIELHLGYVEFKNYNFNRLQYNSAYRLILVGPLPHSTRDKDDYSSVIAKMEQEDGYTKIVRLISNEQLKMTKTNIKEAIRRKIDLGYLAVG